jgi:hypothetical protein
MDTKRPTYEGGPSGFPDTHILKDTEPAKEPEAGFPADKVEGENGEA